MPIRQQTGQTGKETVSLMSFHPLPDRLRHLFRDKFTIPSSVPVDGIIFDNRNILYDEIISQFDLSKSGVGNDLASTTPSPFDVVLPTVFENGTVSVGMADDHADGHLQSFIRFDGIPDLPIHYQTPRLDRDNIRSLLWRVIDMGALPIEFLRHVRDEGSKVVIHQRTNDKKDDVPILSDNIGYLYSSLYQLVWDDDIHSILSSRANISQAEKEYWSKYIRLWREKVLNSSGVFFIAE